MIYIHTSHVLHLSTYIHIFSADVKQELWLGVWWSTWFDVSVSGGFAVWVDTIYTPKNMKTNGPNIHFFSFGGSINVGCCAFNFFSSMSDTSNQAMAVGQS